VFSDPEVDGVLPTVGVVLYRVSAEGLLDGMGRSLTLPGGLVEDRFG